MEPKFQTSFIPKSPVVSGGEPHVSFARTSSIFSIVATILFIITLLVSVGLFIYKGSLNSQISDSDKSLNAAREAFQPEKIQELLDANSRITSAKTLLDSHVAVSQFLILLQSLTVKNLRFDNLVYVNKGNTPTVSMDVEAGSYNALAAQEDVFSKNEFIKSANFSDFSLSDNGSIRAKFFGTLDPQLVSYKKVVSASVNVNTQ